MKEFIKKSGSSNLLLDKIDALMILKLLPEVYFKAMYNAEESGSFIKKEGAVEEKVSSGLNILTTIT